MAFQGSNNNYPVRYTGAKTRKTFTYDAALQFKDTGLVTTNSAALVAGSPRFVDAGTGSFDGNLILDVSASDAGTYTIAVQGATASNFGTPVQLASVTLAATTGRVVLPFGNEQAGTWYRYLRVYISQTGATTGINFTAYAALDVY